MALEVLHSHGVRFFQMVHDLLCVVGIDGRFQYVNEAFTKLLGHDRESLIGQPCLDLVHPDDLEASQQQFGQVTSGRDVTAFENRYRCDDGRYRWLQWTCTPYMDENVVYCVARDVTRQKWAEQAVRDSERRFRQFARQVKNVFWIHTWPDNDFVYTNPAYEEITGRPIQKLHDDPLDWLNAVHPDDRDRVARAYQDRLKTMNFEQNYRVLLPDGGVRWVHDRGFPMTNEQGKVDRIGGIITDITTIKLAEQSLRHERDLLSSLIETSPAGIVMLDRDGVITFANEQAQRVLGLSEATIEGRAYNAPEWKITTIEGQPLPDEDLPFRRVLNTGRACVDYRHAIEWPSGQRRVLSINGVPLMDSEGLIESVVFALEDITDRLAAELALRDSESHYRKLAEMNRRLLQEVNHRVHNNIASLLSVLSLVRKRTADVEQFHESVRSRVLAMNRAHQLLAEVGWQSIRLNTLILRICQTLEPMAVCERLRLEGPAILIPAKQVQPIALTLMELFSNSIKHGAMSVETGQITVTWQQTTRDGKTHIHLTWRECGGPAINAPVEPSLGSELIDGFMRFELSGTVDLTYPRDGVEHKLSFPLGIPGDPPEPTEPQEAHQ